MQYVLMEYDTYFQDVRRTFPIECETEDEAIQKCKEAARICLIIDAIEIQLYYVPDYDENSPYQQYLIGVAYYDDSYIKELVYEESC